MYSNACDGKPLDDGGGKKGGRKGGGREGGRGDDTYVYKTVEIIIKRNLPITAMVVKGLCTVHNLLL